MWWNDYVGRKYIIGEYDCAHLVEDIQREVFDREINLPTSRDGETIRALSKQIDSVKQIYATQTDNPKDGDCVLMKARNILNHIGVYFEKNGIGYVIHNMRNVGSVCTHKMRDLEKFGLKIEGIYTFNHD